MPKWIKLFEAFVNNDLQLFVKKLRAKLKVIKEEEYDTKGYYSDLSNIEGDDLLEDLPEDDYTFDINGRQTFREITSSTKSLWTLKQVANKIGGAKKIADLGCGNGLLIHYCKRLGYDPLGVEYQEKFKDIHKKLGVDVRYGDFFSMDLSFLKDRDLIYLYQPVAYLEDTIELLDLVYNNTKDDVVILYISSLGIDGSPLQKNKKYRVYTLFTEKNYTYFLLVKATRDNLGSQQQVLD